MDYSKSGNAKIGKNAPRYSDHTAKDGDKNPFARPAPKAELLARLKAAAEAKKQG